MDHEQIKSLLRKMLDEEGSEALAKRLGVTRQNIWAVMVGKWQAGGKILKALGIETKVTFTIRPPDKQPYLRMTAVERRTFVKAGMRASQQVQKAIREGKLVRLSKVEVICADCKVKRATDYDHGDYAKPLDVTALCHQCNRKRGPAILSAPVPQRKVSVNTQRRRKHASSSVQSSLSL